MAVARAWTAGLTAARSGQVRLASSGRRSKWFASVLGARAGFRVVRRPGILQRLTKRRAEHVNEEPPSRLAMDVIQKDALHTFSRDLGSSMFLQAHKSPDSKCLQKESAEQLWHRFACGIVPLPTNRTVALLQFLQS